MMILGMIACFIGVIAFINGVVRAFLDESVWESELTAAVWFILAALLLMH